MFLYPSNQKRFPSTQEPWRTFLLHILASRTNCLIPRHNVVITTHLNKVMKTVGCLNMILLVVLPGSISTYATGISLQ